MEKIEKRLDKSVQVLKKYFPHKTEIGLILGSGLGGLTASFENLAAIPYKNIPFFPVSSVKGHSNILIFSHIFNFNLIIMKGRFHYYEGYSLDEITYPVRVMKNLGVKTLIITNASGGINRKFRPGDIMVITDHLNLMGNNPLLGWKREDLAPAFIDMTSAYPRDMINMLCKAGLKNKIKIQKGIYAAMSGPSYETPAEIEMLAKLGADAVGMSTVPEVIVANQLKINVLGLSLITNMAAGILKEKVEHKDVLISSKKVVNKFVKLVKGFLYEYNKRNRSETMKNRHI